MCSTESTNISVLAGWRRKRQNAGLNIRINGYHGSNSSEWPAKLILMKHGYLPGVLDGWLKLVGPIANMALTIFSHGVMRWTPLRRDGKKSGTLLLKTKTGWLSHLWKKESWDPALSRLDRPTDPPICLADMGLALCQNQALQTQFWPQPHRFHSRTPETCGWASKDHEERLRMAFTRYLYIWKSYEHQGYHRPLRMDYIYM